LHKTYIALGTNLGDRVENLRLARQALAPHAKITAESPIYETPPWGYLDQPAFLNQVVEAQTELPPQDLIAHLKGLETRLGRVPGILNGPRVIDLDLLFYDHLRLETPSLTIPHPRMIGRGFVLKPLADLAPDYRHPVFDVTIAEMLQECDLQGIIPYASTETGDLTMSDQDVKPLNWTPDPEAGYTVTRRPDGGMNVRFTRLTPATLQHWREFALQHLLDSDRLTRNLYDLREIEYIPEEAVAYAVEVNNDPAVRNIHLAVVATSEQVSQAMHEISALTTGGVEMAVFKDMETAEAWLNRPLTLVL